MADLESLMNDASVISAMNSAETYLFDLQPYTGETWRRLLFLLFDRTFFFSGLF